VRYSSCRVFGLPQRPSTESHQAVIIAYVKAVPILIPSTLLRVMHVIRKALALGINAGLYYTELPRARRSNWPTSFSWRSGE